MWTLLSAHGELNVSQRTNLFDRIELFTRISDVVATLCHTTTFVIHSNS